MPDPIPAPVDTPDVTIVGGGIAGLTAALRLVERGYRVTVYEFQDDFGGNLGAVRAEGVDHEVYPHMFGDWYVNFWDLVVDVLAEEGRSGEDLESIRARHFVRVPDAGFLQAPLPGTTVEKPRYRLISDNGAITTMLANLVSGVLPLPHMFLAAYAVIDLLSQDYSMSARRVFKGEQTLNGFLASRFYSTEAVCGFYDMLIENIWSVNSDLISAYAFQCFSAFQYRHPSPQCWAITTNSYDGLIVPIKQRLEASGNCRLQARTKVVGVDLAEKGHQVTQLRLQGMNGEEQQIGVNRLLLAASPDAVAALVMGGTASSSSAEVQDSVPIVHCLPQLSKLRQLTSEPIPLLYATFKAGTFSKDEIPDFYVALQGSRYSVTFVRVKSNFHPSLQDPTLEEGAIVLAIGASDFTSIPVPLEDPSVNGTTSGSPLIKFAALPKGHKQEAAFLLLKEFHRFIPTFTLGKCWGDDESDVIWDDRCTFFKVDISQKLFINQVGSRCIAPLTHYPTIENLYFAGDYTDNPIGIATVEAAVTSGLQAAAEICNNGKPAAGQSSGTAAQSKQKQAVEPVRISTPEVYPLPLIFALKLLLAPYAVLARYLADFHDLLSDGSSNPLSLTQGVARIGGQLLLQAARASRWQAEVVEGAQRPLRRRV